jgi:hypothetical protein
MKQSASEASAPRRGLDPQSCGLSDVHSVAVNNLNGH